LIAAFRVRSFRFQWPADLLTSWAAEMETLILAWYVLVNTGSVLMLTLFGSLQFLGTLAAPFFGVLSDRLGSRTMLCVMRATYAVLALIVMTLGLADLLTPTQVLMVAAVSGLVRPNDLVMRNSLIGETIPAPHLMGALAMSRSTMDSARVTGALAGAGLSAALGLGHAYVFVATFYVASLALTLGVARSRPMPDPSRGGAAGRGLAAVVARPSGWREMVDGLAYVWTTPRVLAAMYLAFLVNLTAYPVSGGLMPYVAKSIYLTDATGLGWLVASFSFGALLGSMTLVVTGNPRNPERVMVVNIALWYALLFVFAHVRTFAVAMPLLMVTGLVQSLAMIAMAASLLQAAGDRFRARVMGVRTLAVYGLPLGLMAAGALIERIGYSVAVSLYCALGLAFTVLIGVRWRASVWHGAPAREAGPAT
jgi:MFS family permease